jgi:hypothetical protein
MAAHISSVSASEIDLVTKAEFYRSLRSGDLLFCCGRADISRAIEDLTNSPFSHVLMTWLPPDADAWLTIESTFQRGVHVGQLSAYVDGYEGELVLARRPVLTEVELRKARDAGLRVLNDAYDWKQELSIARTPVAGMHSGGDSGEGILLFRAAVLDEPGDSTSATAAGVELSHSGGCVGGSYGGSGVRLFTGGLMIAWFPPTQAKRWLEWAHRRTFDGTQVSYAHLGHPRHFPMAGLLRKIDYDGEFC